MYVWTTSILPDTGGFPNPPAGYAYATIGPASEFGAVNYGGTRLAVGGVVPAQGTVTPLWQRGTVSAGIYPGISASTKLQLCLWGACETPVPTPRAPWITEVFNVGVPTYPSFGFEAMRVPFQGRRHGTFYMTPPVGSSGLHFAILGIHYGDPAISGGDSVYIADLTGAAGYTFAGGGVTINEATALPTFLPALPGPPTRQAYGYHVGGVDSAECFDELSLIVASVLPVVGGVRLAFIAHAEDNA